MKFCGRIACLRSLPQLDQQLLDRKAPNIGIISLSGAWLDNSLCAQQKMSFMGKQLLDCVAQGKIKLPQITPVDFTANSISGALDKLLGGRFTGKQVVQVSPE